METHDFKDVYISVDVETAGPSPGHYSLLSIGACNVDEPRHTFYVELQPVNRAMTAEAASVHGLDLDTLAQTGLPPVEAMAKFETWLQVQVPPGHKPVFVAFNAPFDWMFVNDYFHRFLGRNPFGYAALDIKALYMGRAGVAWSQTGMDSVACRYLGDHQLSHHALEDALVQAQIFQALLAEIGRLHKG